MRSITMQKSKSISLILAVMFMFTIVFGSCSAAASPLLKDILGHWAQPTIEEMVGQQIISGYPDGTFKPDGNISRAEFATLIVKAFNLETKNGKVFNDTANHWAKSAISTANAYGIVSGYSTTIFGPDDPITREQMAVMVVKAGNHKSSDSVAFTDSSNISAWAKAAVNVAYGEGIIKGMPDGSFAPQAKATRAQAAVVLKASLKAKIPETTIIAAPEIDFSSIDKAGTYGPKTGTKTIEGNVIIKSDGVVLQNLIIKGDLIIAEAVGDGDATLNNVVVKGKTYVRGGGKDSIHINGGQYSEIIVEETATGQVRIVATNTQGIKVTIADNAKGEEIILKGDIKKVTVKADDVKIITQGDTQITEFTVQSGLKGVNIELSKDSTIKEIVLDSKVTVKGDGAIKEASGTQANSSTFSTKPETISKPTSGGGGGGSGSSSTVAVSAISVAPTELTLTVGATGTITATVSPTNASNKNVNWTTSDAKVATVDNGVVTAVAAGTATITATSAADSSKKASCVVTVALASIFESTGNVGIAPESAGEAAGKIYAEYKLVASGEDISLAESNVEYIKVKAGDGEWQSLTANTDATLWFNVEANQGIRTYEVKTKDGKIYTATFNWDQTINTAAWDATDREGDHEGVTYVEYKMMDGENQVSLKIGEVKLIASKDDAGKWVALEANTDETLWFNKTKADGNYDFFVVTSAGTMYKATLEWTQPVSITWSTGSLALSNAIRPTALYDGNYHMWYVDTSSKKMKHATAATVTGGYKTVVCQVYENTALKDWETANYGDNPFVIEENSTYYMFISDPAGSAINVYTSDDGDIWDKLASSVFEKSSEGWDSAKIDNPMVIKDGSEYKLYYQGKNSQGNYQLGLAACSNIDGTYIRENNSNPILSASAEGWDNYRVFQPWVVKDGVYYYMWYAANNTESKGGPNAIGFAYSTDGINWTKAADNPVIQETGVTPLGVPTVVKVDGNWHMLYLSGSNINYASGTSSK